MNESIVAEINAVIDRYAPDLSIEDKEDVRQECCLAIIVKEQTMEVGPGLARRIIRNRIIDWLEKEKGSEKRKRRMVEAGRVGKPGIHGQPVKAQFVSTSEPEVAKKIEAEPAPFNVERWIDSDVARVALQYLPQTEALLLRSLYGIGVEEISVTGIAKLLGCTRMAVYQKRDAALRHLRTILKVKDNHDSRTSHKDND